MYRRQVRRRRAVLVLLVVVSLALISTHFSEGDDGPLHSIQNGVGAALAPITDGASEALKPARDLINWFDETFEARGENDELRGEVRELRRELIATESRLEQGVERGRVARIVAEPPLDAYEQVEARVASRSSSSWSQTLAIDRGSDAGVEIDDPVITGDGLIGRVSSLSGGSARVSLITHRESSVTAIVVGEDGPMGLLGPEVGDPSNLIFELIDSEQELANGEILVTAGFSEGDLSSRFPPGIPIGEVRERRTAEQQRRQQVHLEPFADLARIDFVTVLAGAPSR